MFYNYEVQYKKIDKHHLKYSHFYGVHDIKECVAWAINNI